MTALTSSESPMAIGVWTIANAASLSDALDIQGARLTGIRMPADWTAASLTFEVSENGTDFGPLYNSLGEVVYTVAAAGRCIAIDPMDFVAWRFVKTRSGTLGAAVTQGADRSLVMVGTSMN